MAEEENKVVEQTETPKVEEQPKEQTQEIQSHSFFEEEVNNIVKQRLAKERASIYKKLEVDDINIAIEAVKSQKKADENQKIQKGEFEKILKEKQDESNNKINNLQKELRIIKINDKILSSASKNKAINPDQVVELLKGNINLNDDGQVEVLDKNNTTRYNNKGELLTTDEYVQEFLTQNPHFVSATPSGSGSVSNAGRNELNTPLKLSDLDMTNPEDRKKYAEYRKQRDSQPTVINLTK